MDIAPLLLRSFSASEKTLFLSTVLPTKNFRNFARTILSCGVAFRFRRALALRNYISVAQTTKMKVCDDSNFRGIRRKKRLITSDLIHRAGSVRCALAL